jgi:hypothetical protein
MCAHVNHNAGSPLRAKGLEHNVDLVGAGFSRSQIAPAQFLEERPDTLAFE